MIRIEDLEKENRYLRKEIIDLNLQTSKLKDEKLEEEKQKLYKEATSDKNPNLIDFYRNKNIEKYKKIGMYLKGGIPWNFFIPFWNFSHPKKWNDT